MQKHSINKDNKKAIDIIYYVSYYEGKDFLIWMMVNMIIILLLYNNLKPFQYL